MIVFEPVRLYNVLQSERVRRGFSWKGLEAEIGVSAGTMKRLQSFPVFELDGVLFLTQWLESEIEDFAEGGSVIPGDGEPPFRRFDPPALFDAVDVERGARHLTWEQVAEETEVQLHVLRRLQQYKRFQVIEVLPITQWLQRRLLEFTRLGPPPEQMRAISPAASTADKLR